MGLDFNTEIKALKILYNSLQPKEGEPCAYCGNLATDKEHVTPKSWIDDIRKMITSGLNFELPEEVIVPACHECNMIASNKIFNTFREKKAFIVEQLYKKYQKYLKRPLWKDEEILELKGRLKESVYYKNEINKAVRRRLKRIKPYVQNKK